mmetsp:Transcript_20226/g.29368  ORF Transcript_20226/g.29368 Transcript_20226/m.29368 type:complete len:527 (-) Transcript_20226:43-1623(-)
MRTALRLIGSGVAVYGAAIAAGRFRRVGYLDEKPLASFEKDAELINWSSTHELSTKSLYQPESTEELVNTLKKCQEDGLRIRPMGSGLSPNGIGFDQEGTVSMGLLDKILSVNKEKKTVRVQAGVKVSQLVEVLRAYNLTLQNYASIAEQQIGGFVQVGAHGTGMGIPPVDMQVLSMKILTPGLGMIELNEEKNPILFKLARVALGSLGVMVEATIQCVDAHLLKEHTFVSTAEEIRANHDKWLRSHQHLRYMWIPYSESVIVVWSDPAGADEAVGESTLFSEEEALAAPRALLRSAYPEIEEDQLKEMSFTQIRDELIHHKPLDADHIREVNQAEAEYWKKKEGVRVDWSDRILGFDCGGQQWVSEVAFPCGSKERPSTSDLDFIDDVKKIIEEEKIPAPAPIEQRWTSASSSYLSPVWSNDLESIFSWVGIIMYLPPAGEAGDQEREKITEAFQGYQRKLETELWERYGAFEHWAKIEATSPLLQQKRERIHKRIPMAMYESTKKLLDPQHILSNDAIDAILSN